MWKKIIGDVHLMYNQMYTCQSKIKNMYYGKQQMQNSNVKTILY